MKRRQFIVMQISFLPQLVRSGGEQETQAAFENIAMITGIFPPPLTGRKGGR
jgi:hypothetical protein